MTAYPAGELLEGTLADLRTLLQHPAGLRRGTTQLVNVPNPAANASASYKIDPAFYERIVSLFAILTCSAVAGLRGLQINLLDGDGAVFNITPTNTAINASGVLTVSADLSEAQPPGSGPGAENAGTVTSPAAGAVIASVVLPAGEFVVNWTVDVGGTVGNPEIDGFQLVVGAVVVATSVNGNTAAVNYPQEPQTVVVPAGGATVAVQAINLGTVGAIYRAALEAQLTSGIVACPQLADIILKPSWSVQLQLLNGQAGDQISSVRVLTERYASNWADGSLGTDLEQLLEQPER